MILITGADGFIGTHLSRYLCENGYEIVANLITSSTYFTRPSIVCDTCDACPMTWQSYKGELK